MNKCPAWLSNSPFVVKPGDLQCDLEQGHEFGHVFVSGSYVKDRHNTEGMES